MLEITTQLFPYRLRMQTRQPVELSVTIRNLGKEATLLSYDVNVDRSLSLDKGGYKSTISNKIGTLAPGAGVRGRFEVHAKHLAHAGAHKIYIRATEHFNNYALVKSEQNKEIEILVDK